MHMLYVHCFVTTWGYSHVKCRMLWRMWSAIIKHIGVTFSVLFKEYSCACSYVFLKYVLTHTHTFFRWNSFYSWKHTISIIIIIIFKHAFVLVAFKRFVWGDYSKIFFFCLEEWKVSRWLQPGKKSNNKNNQKLSAVSEWKEK